MLKLKDFIYQTLDRKIVISFCATLILLFTYKFLRVDSFPTKALLLPLILLSLFLVKIKKIESIAYGILCATTSIILLKFFQDSYKTFFVIQEWDFLAFYLFGKVGASGLEIYNPTDFAAIYSALDISFYVDPVFVEEIVNVGFLYPPPVMLLFAPLGSINNIETAYIIWKIFLLLFLVLDIILMIRLLFPNLSSVFQIIFVVGFTLVYPGVMSTIAYSQNNFLLLFFILLIIKYSDNWKSGIFLALAILIKPIAAIWCVYLLINKKWNAMIALTITGSILVVLTIAFFGFHNFITYFTSSPTLRIPQWVYSELINQSLLATLLRLNHNLGFDHSFAFISRLAIVLSLILLVITCIASYKFSRSNKLLSFLIFIPLSLLIYPGTLTYYSVFLMPLFFPLYTVRNYKILLVFAFLIFVMYYSLFLASFFLLTCFVVYSFLKPQTQEALLKPEMPGSVERRAWLKDFIFLIPLDIVHSIPLYDRKSPRNI